MRMFRFLVLFGVLFGFVSGCATRPSAESEAAAPPAAGGATAPATGSLAGTKWELVQFQSMDDAIGTIKPTDPSVYTMELMPDGQLAMRLDCNRAVGRWEAQPASQTDGHITLSAPAMTRAFCGEGSMDSRIARDLEFVVSYKLVGDTLNLALKMDSGIYTWRRIAH
jgi:heat shock protein HslJ